MKVLERPNDAYSPEWFRNRALTSLHRIDENTWDFSDSLLLYAPGEDERYEAVQETETPYNRLVTVPEREYLKEIAHEIASALPDVFEYIDLGPGTEHKEQFLFDALRALGKKFTYVPVDISERFLQLAGAHASEQGIPVRPTRNTFEELALALPKSKVPRFVSLGLTFSNYEPKEILTLLKGIAGERGTVFIDSHMNNRVDMEAVRNLYTGDVYAMTDGKAKLLGINPDEDIEKKETDDGVRVWYTLKNVPMSLESVGLKTGDKLLMLRSLRSTPEELEKNIREVFHSYHLLDTKGPFVGALLKS